ncbi:MAG: hypothetical protein ABSA49_12485 [Rhizomicrobium sp.]
MTKTQTVFLLVFLLVAAAAGAVFSTGLVNLGVHATDCAQDNEIASSRRDAIDAAAMAFVKAALGPNPASAYAMMTSAAKTSVPAGKFTAFLKQMNETSGPFKNTRVLHTYYIESAGTGPDARAICGKVSGDDWVSVQVKPGLSQAHVLIASSTANNGWALTLWLLPAGDGWQVQYFNMSVSSISGLTPDMLLARAREEREAGRSFNAAMLYTGVQGTIDRGPAFQLGIEQALQCSCCRKRSGTASRIRTRRTAPSSRRSSRRIPIIRACSPFWWPARSSRTIPAATERSTKTARASTESAAEAAARGLDLQLARS